MNAGFGLEAARRVLAAQPFSRLLGAELAACGEGRAELVLGLRETFLQQHGFVHGGVLSYLADNALTFAGGSLWGDGLTAQYTLHYLRPARGERLVARAEVIHAGRRRALCRCQIVARDGEVQTPVVFAIGTIVNPGAS